MLNNYSIIIPIYNELEQIPQLLNNLKSYFKEGHELIIVDDGSNDGSDKILLKCDYIKLFRIEENKGKGAAIKIGLMNAINEMVVIFDGDLELHPKYIKKLMILNSSKNINCALANRLEINKIDSIWNIGNIILTRLFNFLNKSDVKDALCCAKSFLKSDINIKNIKSQKFDIDVELCTKLVKIYSNIENIDIKYQRRTVTQGKKLKFRDSYLIIKRILDLYIY